ncbi:MAG: fumarylacetoacetate hydrolase family protein [Rubellimicrobium sp.]|nr:fumarylacetoacetate hydrolase family protein [Rubellimicrobium sp.]
MTLPRLAFAPAPPPLLPVAGTGLSYPVRRIFCVGRNYEAHAAEMGGTADREAPWFFLKSAQHLHPAGADLPYPPGTADLQHEVELVVALGEGGVPWGWAVGLDMTRRDLQARAKEARRPWDVAKDYEGGAVIGPILRNFEPAAQELALRVNGDLRQRAPLSDMVWDVAGILRHLAGLYAPGPGDLVMTGTPAGVGPVGRGDTLEGTCAGLPPVVVRIV